MKKCLAERRYGQKTLNRKSYPGNWQGLKNKTTSLCESQADAIMVQKTININIYRTKTNWDPWLMSKRKGIKGLIY